MDITRRTLTRTAWSAPLVLAAANAPAHAASQTDYVTALSVDVFSPYIGEGTVMTRRLDGVRSVDSASMPESTYSDAIANNMRSLALRHNKFGVVTSMNTILDNIPIYIVDSTNPNQEYITMTSTDLRITRDDDIIAATLGRIPLHSWAKPLERNDRAMAIYDYGTGLMREYFGVFPIDVNDPRKRIYRAASAGYYQARPRLAGLGEDNPWLQLTKGSSSVVAMLNPLTQIGINEALDGYIGHALSFTISNAHTGFSWPARQGDGQSPDTNVPYQGQWFRIRDDADLSRLRPFTKVVARACQTYGGYAADKNLFCHAFNAEHPATWIHEHGRNPWTSDVPKKYGNLSLNDFPWHMTEWAPKDWGKPA